MKISNDLIIKVKGSILNTPTNDGFYDKNGHEYKYVPGMDFSSTDNVTKGNIATYLIDISLNSKSNQKYNIDLLTISAYDYPNDPKKIKIYYINKNPDAMNIKDDKGNYYSGIDAQLYPCIFNNSINSFSNFTTSILVKIPNASYWKTKLNPQIKVTAKKNQDEKSFIMTLPEIKIAPKSSYISNLFDQTTTLSNYNCDNGPKDKIKIPVAISSYIKGINKTIYLNNSPNFKEVEYNLKINLLINSMEHKLSKTNFKISCPKGFKISNYSYIDNKLKIKIKGPFEKTNANSTTDIKIIIPLKIYEKSTLNLDLYISWDSQNPVNIICKDNYQILYSIETEGNIQKSIKL